MCPALARLHSTPSCQDFFRPRPCTCLCPEPQDIICLIIVIAATAGILAEWKRRDHKRDESKRRTPYRRNSAMHLYDGTPVPRHTIFAKRGGSYEIFVPHKDSQSCVVINPIRSVIFDATNNCLISRLRRREPAAPSKAKSVPTADSFGYSVPCGPLS
jgi:hypothetical protein